jgi:gamma-glutamyltranspeptidase/glutathione hydrolase
MHAFKRLIWVAAAAILTGCVTTPRPPEPKAQPYVIAANPLAAQAGMNVLQRGGSAVDAAIAVEAMLSLVEPQSSGVGGGAFMTHYDAGRRRVSVYDGRETAPAGATPDMFMGEGGAPLSFPQAVVSGRATGVPGVLRMLELAHREHGRLPWRNLFGEVERTARDGFIVSPRLGRVHQRRLSADGPAGRPRLFRGKRRHARRSRRPPAQPAYADFLRRLAAQGADALHRGPTAERIVARTRAGPLPGTLTLADLANYRPIKRDPLCRPYRAYQICVPPPPSSGLRCCSSSRCWSAPTSPPAVRRTNAPGSCSPRPAA